MKLPKLETLPNRDRKKRFVSEHCFSELTALCPVTRLPDFYFVKLTYEPDARLVELRSLKLYFGGYRTLEILHEELANRVLDDLIEVTDPRWAKIELRVAVRGGISTVVTRTWTRDKGDVVETHPTTLGEDK